MPSVRPWKLVVGVALAWGLSEALLVFILGTTLFPIGWFVILISFISGYYLAEIERATRALILSQFVTFTVSFLVLLLSGTPIKGLYGDVGLLLELPLLFVALFLLSLSSLFGALLGDIMSDRAGMWKVSISNYRGVALVILLVCMVALSAFGMQQYVNAKVREATPTSTPVSLVSNRQVYWSNGTERVWANFTDPFMASGNLYAGWLSSSNISFSLFLGPNQVTTVRSNGCCDGSSVIPVTGPSYNAFGFGFVAWFSNSGCSSSGCPPGWVNYTINELVYTTGV